MRGKKAKVLRLLARYDVSLHRPEASRPAFTVATLRLPKEHPRHKYQFLKRRYHMVPLAFRLRQMKRTAAIVAALD